MDKNKFRVVSRRSFALLPVLASVLVLGGYTVKLSEHARQSNSLPSSQQSFEDDLDKATIVEVQKFSGNSNLSSYLLMFGYGFFVCYYLSEVISVN